MSHATTLGYTEEAIALLRTLAGEAGLDPMTEETWPTADNQLWDDSAGVVEEGYESAAAMANAAAAGDAGALARLRADFKLPVL